MAAELEGRLHVITVAVDAGGPSAAAPWVPEDPPFAALVDRNNLLGRAAGTTVVPAGLLIDESGTLRWYHFGGFNVGNEDDLKAVYDFAVGQRHFEGEAVPSAADLPEAAERAGFLFEKGVRLLQEGDAGAATTAWREALKHQPDNYIIRKQIWRVEHPERFSPEIDWDWQRQQRARERRDQADPTT